jgi:hypothetical protein
VNTTKAATKALKVSKIPVSKPDSSVLSRTTKGATLGANDSKRNQTAQQGSFVVFFPGGFWKNMFLK